VSLKELFRRKSPVEKASKDLREPFAQPDVRRAAMATLIDIGTDEAYRELLKRFSYNSHGNIADESEKRDLVDEIVQIGEPMIVPLKGYIESEKTVTFPIRALGQIIDKPAVLEFLVATLATKEPLDHRSTDAKRALIIAIGDMGDKEHAPALIPYLGDHNDDVQMQTIDALERLANPDTAEALAGVCAADSHAARIQHRAAHALEKLEWPVKAQYDRFVPDVKAEFLLGKKGVLLRKSGKKEE